MKVRFQAILLASMLGTACASGCSSSGAGGAGGEDSGGGEITVFAAASLTQAFTEMGAVFEEQTGTTPKFNFASSSDLAVQITEGAPADVFASADTVQMGVVEDEGLAENPKDFVTNQLVILTPADNPAGIHSPDDLTEDGVKVVLAAPEVPAGNYARQAFNKLGIEEEVEANVVSNEDDVKQVVTKVQLGEADAGVSYVTDVTSNVEGDVSEVDFPPEVNDEVVAVYPITVLSDAPNSEGAQEFYDLVLSDEGQQVLASHGFGTS
jgi:molybdate transport system substrate-binding protein